ncbi:hypothetical protein B0T14DRAFT_501467 [Immersiella caudata]|uniref:Heterokaryon incompatibility domain-containing protein n=1 Tax=Immersiella caudata TaxID=314043 RepID=A0AA39XCU7_9PEZI|nr:hypothetical protein B0T14DRAFT_501467 [Immersiella caudata]
MRLLNVTTMQVEQFFPPNIPKYAILSHTWGPETDEISLSEMETIARHRLTRKQQLARIIPRNPDKADTMKMLLLSSMLMAFRGGSSPHNPHSMSRPPTPPTITDALLASANNIKLQDEKGLVPAALNSSHVLELKPGFMKISLACGQAEREGLQYIWVDTCCIDKTSTAEVSLALNSMYSWYASAAVCYAFLDDVQHGGHRGGYRIWKDDFADSKWFKRGWTLQELLAPRKVVFFGKGWKELGTKAKLGRTIEKATGIARRTLLEPGLVSRASVAKRMSWASARKTTLPEDMAYCLMGIFGVHISPLYGEGAEHAFLRLQEEILRRSDDMSLLAWGILNQEDRPVIHHTTQETFDSDNDSLNATLPVLATSPADFAGMGAVICAPLPVTTPTADFALTNKGLHINLPLLQVGHSTHSAAQKYYLAALACRNEKEDPHDRMGIFLTNSPTSPSIFVRTRTQKHTRISGEDLALKTTKPTQIYISSSPDEGFIADPLAEEEKIFIKAGELISPGYEVVDICAKHAQWNREYGVARIVGMKPEGLGAQGGVYQLATIMLFNRPLGSGFVARILVGSGEGEVWVDLAPVPPKPDIRVGPGEIDDEDEALNRIRGETRRLWENPGRITLDRMKKVGGKMVSRAETVEVVNPDLVGDEEEDGVSVSARGRGSGEVQELRPQVLFEENWEKLYHRMVNAHVERRKRGVIVLEMTSMLFAGA